MRSSPGLPAPVVIGSLTFDAARRQLVGKGGAADLSAKELAFLSLLVSKSPSAVSKDEIRDAVWPRTVVTEASLTSLVKDLRAKLGQAGRSGPIRTVHGFGYALTLERETPSPGRMPRLVRGATEIAISTPELVLGRAPDLPGTIDADSVSRRHARVTWDGRTATLSDLRSKNGTYVNGARVEGTVVLADEDVVRLGLVTFVFRAPRTGSSRTRTLA